MASYHIEVTEVHPDGDINVKGSKKVFSKECLTVGEANALFAAKKEQYYTTMVEGTATEDKPNGDRVPSAKGKIQYSVTKEHY